jgi:phosphate starvation-inducible protein PhoH and related proteins
MLNKTHNDPVFQEKRKPKNPIKFRINLNEEQKRAKEIILNSKVAVLAGKAGSALDGLFTKQYEKIIITRPTVSKEEIGFLPGDLHQKMDPWVQPIYQNMYILYGKDRVQPYIERGEIEIVPLSFMRGRTFLDSAIIVDEAQNVTMEQMEMIVTRLGLRSKMMICGDDAQVDLKNRSDSGFKFLYSAAKKVKNLEAITLLENHRDPIVDDLIDMYEEESLKRMPQKR